MRHLAGLLYLFKMWLRSKSDVNEEVKGPSRKIAQDDQGNWSKAALGFARSQGVEPEQLYFQELAGVEYVYANKSSIGAETAAVLAGRSAFVDYVDVFPEKYALGKS